MHLEHQGWSGEAPERPLLALPSPLPPSPCVRHLIPPPVVYDAQASLYPQKQSRPGRGQPWDLGGMVTRWSSRTSRLQILADSLDAPAHYHHAWDVPLQKWDGELWAQGGQSHVTQRAGGTLPRLPKEHSELTVSPAWGPGVLTWS